jgi:hypothetical protein
MQNGPERQAVIDEMTEVARRDAPWIWGLHPKQFSLFHSWIYNVKPNFMANNTLKYKRLDPVQRNQLRTEWNAPITWPVLLGSLVFVAALLPAVLTYRRKLRASGVK